VYTENPKFSLLQTARESYQHFISDETVQLSNLLDVHKDSSLRFAENYKCGNLWLEVLIRSSAYHVEAIIGSLFADFCEVCSRDYQSKMLPMGERDLGLDADSSVLIDPVQLMQAPQRVDGKWQPCRSIVWLKRFDVVDSGRTETIDFSVESRQILGVRRLMFKNGEFARFGVFPASVINQRPNSLIESSSQALEIVSAEEINRHMGLLFADTIADLIPFRFLIGSDGMGIRAEVPNCHHKFVQMTLCPLGLPMSIS
jgi:hypothetical protein